MNKLSKIILTGLFALAGINACTKKTDSPKVSNLSPVDRTLKLIETAPSYTNYIQLGLEYAKEKKSAEALAAYNKAIAINPKAPLAWNNICAELNAQERFAEAINFCDKAVHLEPDFVLAQNNLKYAQSKIETMRATFIKQKIELFSKKDAPAQEYISMGLNFYALKEYPTSVEIWSKIKPSDPLYAMSLNNIASAYIVTSDFKRAEKALKKALELEPTNANYLSNQKWLEEARAAKK